MRAALGARNPKDAYAEQGEKEVGKHVGDSHAVLNSRLIILRQKEFLKYLLNYGYKS